MHEQLTIPDTLKRGDVRRAERLMAASIHCAREIISPVRVT